MNASSRPNWSRYSSSVISADESLSMNDSMVMSIVSRVAMPQAAAPHITTVASTTAHRCRSTSSAQRLKSGLSGPRRPWPANFLRGGGGRWLHGRGAYTRAIRPKSPFRARDLRVSAAASDQKFVDLWTPLEPLGPGTPKLGPPTPPAPAWPLVG